MNCIPDSIDIEMLTLRSLIRAQFGHRGVLRSLVRVSRRHVPVLLMACALSGCVAIPYKPKAEVEQTPRPVIDPQTIVVTTHHRGRVDDIGDAIEKADKQIKIIDPLYFMAAAFPDDDTSLSRMLEPDSLARVREHLALDYVVLAGEISEQTIGKVGDLIPWVGVYGATKSVERTSIVATIVDIERGRLLSNVESMAEGLLLGVGAFYGVAVVPFPTSSALDGLGRGLVASMRADAGPGPLRITVVAVEKVFIQERSLTPEEALALEQRTREASRRLVGEFSTTSLGEPGRQRNLLIVDPTSIEVAQLSSYVHNIVASVSLNETQQTAVRDSWGEPWLSSDLWHIDIFRLAASGVEGLYGYVLISYDDGGVSDAIDAGIFLDAPVHVGSSSPAAIEFVKPSIVAGGFELALDVLGRPVLTVEGTKATQVLGSYRSPRGCLVTFGSTEQSQEHWSYYRRFGGLRLCSADSGFSGYTIDDTQVFDDSAWVVRVSEQPAGRHVLGVAQNARHVSAVPESFECAAGNAVHVQAFVRYMQLPNEDDEVDLVATFSVTQSMEPSLANRPLVLTSGHEWFAPH